MQGWHQSKGGFEGRPYRIGLTNSVRCDQGRKSLILLDGIGPSVTTLLDTIQHTRAPALFDLRLKTVTNEELDANHAVARPVRVILGSAVVRRQSTFVLSSIRQPGFLS